MKRVWIKPAYRKVLAGEGDRSWKRRVLVAMGFAQFATPEDK